VAAASDVIHVEIGARCVAVEQQRIPKGLSVVCLAGARSAQGAGALDCRLALAPTTLDLLTP
jgi:hypothetical protein